MSKIKNPLSRRNNSQIQFHILSLRQRNEDFSIFKNSKNILHTNKSFFLTGKSKDARSNTATTLKLLDASLKNEAHAT